MNFKNFFVMLCVGVGGYNLATKVPCAHAQIASLPHAQQRVFYTDDVIKMMSKAIYTLQDMDYTIDYIDFKKGKIYAESLRDWTVQTTVTVKPDHKGHVFVGIYIVFGDSPVYYSENPRAYDAYFKALATNYLDKDI